MGIFDFFKSSSGSKIKVRRYYDEASKELNLPEIIASLSKTDQSSSISAKFGQIQTSSKITIPEGISSELVVLDQLQEQLANAINGLKGENRQEQLIKYTDTLMKMMEYRTKTDVKTKEQILDEQKKTKNGQYSDLKKFLDDRKFKSALLPDDLNRDQGYIIWPVTLLSKTTYIHKAQAQLIRLLVNSGWKLHVIIGDCGRQLNWKRDFTDNLKKILAPLDIEINDNTIAFLGDYYRQDDSSAKQQLLANVESKNILSFFHQISEGLDWNKFDSLIKKNYDEAKRNEIGCRTVLNNIQPLLIWSLVTSIVKGTQSKSILIAGEDEQDQWKYITDGFTANNLGLIYIHELKKQDNKTMDQNDLKMDSKEEMSQKLGLGNMAQWLFTHFVELPKFSNSQRPTFCKISENECIKYKSNCIHCLFEEGQNYTHTDFNKQLFIDNVWPMANPANN